jgi:hypothetical protein
MFIPNYKLGMIILSKSILFNFYFFTCIFMFFKNK